MSTESDECYVDECRTSKDDDTEHNLIIDTEETSAASTPLSAKIVCTSDGTVFVAEPEHRQFLSLLPQSDIIAKNELWPRIRQLYHSTSTDSVVSVYKPVDCNQLFSKANEKSPVYCNHLVNERLLICFVCNLSFSSTLSFLCHIKEPPHSVQLSTDERQIVIFEPSVSVVLQSFDNSSLDNNCVVSILVKDGEKSWENFASGSSSSFCADEITTTNYANSEFTSSTIEQTGQPSLAAYCSLHPEGKSAGVECPKCDLILGSSRSLGGHMTMMHSRNSCKTLKCPKCNWHYKYQETLEIHMKEKHSDAPTTCPYCVSNIPHPRLGRGEQWSCGYKPFRCDVCKYSTTTKGNLAIHMQSDKHLNNVQEIQQTDYLADSANVVVNQSSSSSSSLQQNFNPIASPSSTTQMMNKMKPVLRCDVCNYETNVARNLRIHMTSEKHASNVLLLQQSVKQYQQQNFVIAAAHAQTSTTTDLHQHFRNALCNVTTPFSSQTPNTTQHNLNINADDINSSLALSLQNSYLQRALDEEKVFQCCICMNFVCDTVDELIQHCQNVDRSQPNDGDVSLITGNYLCNLCNYKTHLKANFQLHTKTDKHLQRLQLVNHIREGGTENELRMKYLNLNNPIQLRCVACNEFANSFHKIQMHAATMRHKSFVESFQKISCYATTTPSASKLYCTLCGFVSKNKRLVYAHLHSEQHNELANQFLPMMESSGSSACWIEIRDDLRNLDSEQEEGFESDVDGDEEDEEDEELLLRCNNNCNENDTVDAVSSIMSDGAHCCSRCTFATSDVREFCKHVCQVVKSEEDNINNSMNNNMQIQKFLCPLCQNDCGCNKEQLECHLSQIHNVSNEVIKSLMNLLPTTSSSATNNDESSSSDEQKTFSCPLCSVPFEHSDDLYAHQMDVGHTETKQTPEGPSYLCWWKGCNQYFKSPLAVQNHFREIHHKNSKKLSSTLLSSPTSSCVQSDRHAYRFRCTQCSLAFISEDKLRAHQQYHVIRAATKCAICGRTFRSTVALKKHVETTHINLNAAELLQYKAQLMSNDDGDDTVVVGQQSSEENVTTVSSSSTSAAEMSSEDKLEEHLNSAEMAISCYNDVSRKFKCHRCKMAFTKQTFLSIHNRTLQHRRGEKSPNYNVERYHDPSRPFKCEICKESFTQKSILLVHLNSVLHLHKMKKANTSSYSPTTMPLSSSSSTTTNGKLAVVSSCSSSKSTSSSTVSSSAHKQLKQEQQQINLKDSSSKQLFQLPVSTFNPSVENSFASLFHSFKNTMSNGDLLDFGGSSGFAEPSAKQLVNDMLMKKQQQQQNNNNAKANNNKSHPLMSPSLIQQMQEQSAAAFLQMATLAPLFNSLLPYHQGQQKGDESSLMTNGDHHNFFGQQDEGPSRKSSTTSPSQVQQSNIEQTVARIGRATLNSNKSGGRGITFKRLLEDYGFEVVMQYNESSSFSKKRSKSVDEQQLISNETSSDTTGPLNKKPKLEIAESEAPEAKLQECSPSVPELTKCTCIYCGNHFSSVWVLKAHMEHVHRELIPLGEVEKVSEEFKEAYEKKHPVAVGVPADDASLPSSRATPAGNLAENVKPTKQHHTQPQQQPPTSLNMMGLAAMAQAPVTSQAAAAAAMSLSLGLGMQFPFVGMPFMPFSAQNPYLPMMIPPGFDTLNYPPHSQVSTASTSVSASKQFSTSISSMAPTPMVIQQQQKRARTRITDDQLKVLREYFDINNSPTEEQIEQMSLKSGLPQKVIKHWFRNTLFKERQRSKDSPYNFNIPPSLGIDLEEYEKTGEAKVISVNPGSEWPAAASSSNSVEINCGEPEPAKTSNEDQTDDNVLLTSSSVIKVEPNLGDNLTSSYNNSLYAIKEERPDSVDDSMTSQDGQLDDFSRDRTPSFGDSSYANAQETLRRLTNVLPSLQVPFPNSVASQLNFFNTKSSASTSSQQCTIGQDLTSMITNALSPSAQLTAAGRRANRTRFTEWQVKVLQDFFEKNAYPKDDDLENLSKTLSLSPRVIVVWFQNARQKARKVYENLPQENDDRFLRTPGLNYQCKKCNLVFQRYYELIKHQKSLCFKDENIGLNGEFGTKKSFTLVKRETTSPAQQSFNNNNNSNTSGDQNRKSANDEYRCDTCDIYFNGPVQFDEHLKVHACNPLLFAESSGQQNASSSPSETSQRQNLMEIMKSSSSSGEVSPDTAVAKRQRTQILPEQLELLYETYRKDTKPSIKVLDQISAETGLSKRVVQVWFQNTRMRERRGQISNDIKPAANSVSNNNSNNNGPKFFNKRCPFCGILFHSKLTMESHMTHKHPSQYSSVGVDIDALPDAEEVPTITTVPLTEALWNAFGSTTDSSGIAQSMLSIGVPTMVPGTTTVVASSNHGQKNDITSIVDRIATGKMSAEELPLDLSRALKQSSGGGDKSLSLIADEFRIRQTPSASYSNEDEISFNSMEDDDMHSSNSQDSPSPHHQVLAALTRPQKRFRTHLTLQQIKVMKYLFQDFKTPTMAECEALGNEIGLYKRVVQVWFQNARAKERKVKVVGAGGSDDGSSDVKPAPAKCSLCNVPYCGRINMQDHSFSKSHIDKIKQTVDDPLEGGQFIIDVNDESSYVRTSSNGQSSSKASSNNDHSNSCYASHELASAVGTSSSLSKHSTTNAQKHSQSPQPSRKKTPQDNSTTAAMAVAQNLLPYMYSAGNPAAAYYASMMMPAGFSGLSNGGLFYDPNLHGTPVNLLQIPPNVMQVITNGLQRGKESSCRFTQDGKTVADLVKVLDAKDKNCIVEKDLEVGWACRRCVTVFQAEHLFVNHQNLICQSKDSPFKLIQTHYDCTVCKQWFGTQVEFKKHCELPEHSSKCASVKRR